MPICLYVTCITTIDTIILTNYTNHAYIFDTYTSGLRVVLNEIAQILLYLIVEKGVKFIPSIVHGCSGLEEFSSLVLLYLVHQPYEGTHIHIHTYTHTHTHRAADIHIIKYTITYSLITLY
jgi:hypothetical protein